MSAKRLKPKPLVISDTEGFQNTDLFGLSEYGERLANLVCNVEDPLVTILDGPWGSGKTIFAKQWAGLMRQRGACVIYFDAFASDHYEDALTPLAAQILSAMPKKKGIKKLKTAALQAGKQFLPIGANLLIRAFSSGLVSLGDLRGAEEEATKDLSKKTGLIIEKTLEARLKSAEQEKTIFDDFRGALGEVAKKASNSESDENFPLVFIVDELDRCRPTFAINLIERVKHLFSVPGVQFLLVAHLDQLEEAIRHCYGLGLEGKAKIYLEKFYDVRMRIPEDRINPPTDKYAQKLWKELDIDSDEHSRILQLRFLCFEHITMHKKLSFRTIEKIISNIALIRSVMPRNNDLTGGFVIEGLCIIRHLNPKLHDRICSGLVMGDIYDLRDQARRNDESHGKKLLSELWTEIKDFFELEKWDSSEGRPDVGEWLTKLWTDENIDGSYDTYLKIEVIHLARVIDSMSNN